MSELHWIWLTEVGNIPLREGRRVDIGGRQLAIFNLGDKFVVVDNLCPHKGGPLADGMVAGDSVVCPLHAWKINLASGQVERPSSTGNCVRSYPTRVDNGIVVVGLPASFLQPAAAAILSAREAAWDRVSSAS